MKQNRQPGLQCHNKQKTASKTRLTFRELVNRKEDNVVKVNCNKGMNVEIGKVGRGMFADRGRKVAKKERVAVGGRGTLNMKDCLEAYIIAGGKQYIFSGVEYSRPHSHRGKSLSILSQLISQTKQKQYINTQKKQLPKERIISKNREEKPLISYLSERNIKPEQKRPALKSIENINPNQVKIQLKGPVQFKKTQKQNYFNISAPKKPSLNQKETDSANNPAPVPVPDPNPDIIRLKSIQIDPSNPRFSFGEMMKLGMISPDSLPNNKVSFKLAGEDELQGKRKESNQLEFQEFSSIISNQLKETRKDLELDSIKNDIEKIQSCLEKLPQPPKQEKPAPFRFRKKQEVVQHLVTARIVSKESSSINIP